jgi:hypothetical protein
MSDFESISMSIANSAIKSKYSGVSGRGKNYEKSKDEENIED